MRVPTSTSTKADVVALPAAAHRPPTPHQVAARQRDGADRVARPPAAEPERGSVELRRAATMEAAAKALARSTRRCRPMGRAESIPDRTLTADGRAVRQPGPQGPSLLLCSGLATHRASTAACCHSGRPLVARGVLVAATAARLAATAQLGAGRAVPLEDSDLEGPGRGAAGVVRRMSRPWMAPGGRRIHWTSPGGSPDLGDRPAQELSGRRRVGVGQVVDLQPYSTQKRDSLGRAALRPSRAALAVD